MQTWNEKAEEMLRQMWEDHVPSSLIAEALRMTRNAVCGKLARMRLHRNGMRNLGYSHATHRVSPLIGGPRVKKSKPAARPIAPALEVISDPVPILEAKSFHCRAVLDQRGEDGFALFCGAPKLEGSSWCAAHHRRFTTLSIHMRRL